MALLEIPYQLMPKIALLCNLIVVTGGTYIFYKERHLSLKKTAPFIVGSIPMALVGGLIKIEKENFLFLLAVALLIASIKMIAFPENKNEEHKKAKIQSTKMVWIYGMSIGSGLGFLAGLVGIGGGIFLSPILHLTRWGTAKQIAATASFFILTNSLSGLIGQFSKNTLNYDFQFILALVAAVLLGGQIGSRLGAKVFSEKIIKKITVILMLLVSLRILYKLFG